MNCPRCGLELTSKMLNRRGGRPHYGYLPGEAETLAIMRELRAKRLTYGEVAGELNDSRIPTRSGKPWRISTVAGILSRITSLGDGGHRHAD